MLLQHGCRRCGGSMFEETDGVDSQFVCFQCGGRVNAATRPSLPIRRVRLTGDNDVAQWAS